MPDIYSFCPLSVYLLYHCISYKTNTWKTGRRWNYHLHLFCKQHKETTYFVTLPVFSLATHHIHLLNIYHEPFVSNALFQASVLHFRPLSVSLTNAKASRLCSSSRNSDLTSVGSASNTIINNKRLNTDHYCILQSYLDQEIITESPIDLNTTSSIPIYLLHYLNQPLFYA